MMRSCEYLSPASFMGSPSAVRTLIGTSLLVQGTLAFHSKSLLRMGPLPPQSNTSLASCVLWRPYWSVHDSRSLAWINMRLACLGKEGFALLGSICLSLEWVLHYALPF